ncbi:MAG: hypothetical protein Q7I93_04225 [Syntrophales bacterium]|nr:hypothetical protein [Syntrophales bacterium]
MPTAIERRLDMLVHEINEIKKEVILQKIQNVATTAGKMNHWRSLGSKISEKWDQVSAVDEIRGQREKR